MSKRTKDEMKAAEVETKPTKFEMITVDGAIVRNPAICKTIGDAKVFGYVTDIVQVDSCTNLALVDICDGYDFEHKMFGDNEMSTWSVDNHHSDDYHTWLHELFVEELDAEIQVLDANIQELSSQLKTTERRRDNLALMKSHLDLTNDQIDRQSLPKPRLLREVPLGDILSVELVL